MDIIDTAHRRYSTKSFDPTRAIPADLIEKIKDLLRVSPSSVNLQPWHFIIAETDAGKARVAKATEGLYRFNNQKVLNAGLTVVFCARTDIDDTHLAHLTAQEFDDGRYTSAEDRDAQHAKRAMFVNLHKSTWNDLDVWTAKQTYLNLGYFLLGVAALGLDAVPVEGFDAQIMDQEFNLPAQGLKSLAIVPVGYHADDDFNAKLPKSRLTLDKIITTI